VGRHVGSDPEHCGPVVQLPGRGLCGIRVQHGGSATGGGGGLAGLRGHAGERRGAVCQLRGDVLLDRRRRQMEPGAHHGLERGRAGVGDPRAGPFGNAATSVVWNPVRQLFVAAVRFHGYYQSADGVTWTRLAAQPGTGLTTSLCPANPGSIGSTACPIYRGTLAVNPMTGDTFAWTVDINMQDKGLWQDQCN